MEKVRMFFFVKKNQKTFDRLVPSHLQAPPTMDKSFLLLFYEKAAITVSQRDAA
jgi:hypothetical protein